MSNLVIWQFNYPINYPITRLPNYQMLIALGVTGGIGAYKAVEVDRGLQKRGHDVVAVMTP